MQPEIVTVAARPELVAPVSRWIWAEWGQRKGRPLELVAARMRARTAAVGPEQVFILLDGGEPAATASLVREDLDERPELTPWLASVFVAPEFRGRGHAVRVVRAVEAACIAARIPTLWLHTETAQPLYERLGWVNVAPATDWGHEVMIMRRDLPVPAA